MWVSLRRACASEARSVNEDLCTGCGRARKNARRRVVDTAYEAGMGKRKAIYRPFAQGDPQLSGD